MSSILRTRGKEPITAVLESVSNGRRRRILALLRDSPDPLDEETLAERLMENANGRTASGGSDDAVRSVRVELAHVHLPKLEDANLVDRDDGAVTTGSHPILDEPEFDRIRERTGEEWDERLSCLADERRREILAVLDARSGSAPRHALAHEVVSRESGGDPSTEAVESAIRSLHHVHLPKLEDAGLVEIDREDGTVTDAGGTSLGEWLFETNRERSTDVSGWLARSSG